MGRGVALLIVEQDESLRDAVRLALEASYRVLSVSDDARARRILDSVLLDLLVVDFDDHPRGHAVLLRQLAHAPHAPVVVAVAGSDRNAETASLFGVPVVRKPIDGDALLAAVSLSSERKLRPSLS